MNPLHAIALLGTAKNPPPAPTLPTDALVEKVAELSPERSLLLRAGLASIYGEAGFLPAAASPPPAIAPPESSSPCPAAVADLLPEIWALPGREQAVQFEALEMLAVRRMLLPPAFLARALASASTKRMQAALLPVLGERGRWLAQFNPDWKWATVEVATLEQLPEDADARWETGTAEQRVELLQLVRRIDPARGRAWVMATWASETADTRREFLSCLGVGLSADDGPILDLALQDRGSLVRSSGAALAAKLPEHPLTVRMRERAFAMLSYTKGLPLVGTVKLRASPPAEFDKSWAADGIDEKPPRGEGPRAYWLRQVIGFVDPAEWVHQFGVTPTVLLKAAKGDEYGFDIIRGWATAIERFKSKPWMFAFLEYDWGTSRDQFDQDLLRRVGNTLGALDRDVAMREATRQLLKNPHQNVLLPQLLNSISRPWSHELTSAYWDQVNAAADSKDQSATHIWSTLLVELAANRGDPAFVPPPYPEPVKKPVTVHPTAALGVTERAR